jgi:hypothetical protein
MDQLLTIIVPGKFHPHTYRWTLRDTKGAMRFRYIPRTAELSEPPADNILVLTEGVLVLGHPTQIRTLRDSLAA